MQVGKPSKCSKGMCSEKEPPAHRVLQAPPTTAAAGQPPLPRDTAHAC